MLTEAKILKGYRLDGLDGEIGAVKEFYFDDKHWTVRYLVADTGNWLTGRQVLISPHALLSVARGAHHIGISLTKKQIEDSPPLNSDKPVSRQFEETYYGYYGWPTYWGGPFMWGDNDYPGTINNGSLAAGTVQGVSPNRSGSSVSDMPNPEGSGGVPKDDDTWDPRLRSMHNVIGHHIQATDGEIGHVEDFIIDDATWAIRYLMVDTVNWWPGKKVLVSPHWIDRVSWGESKVFINLSREAIRSSPEYTKDAPLTQGYEADLHQHHDPKGYWIDSPENNPTGEQAASMNPMTIKERDDV